MADLYASYPAELQPILLNPQLIDAAVYIKKLTEYLLTYELDGVEEMLGRETGRSEEDTSLQVLYGDLADYDSELAVVLVHHPYMLMRYFNNALYDVQELVVTHPAYLQKTSGRKGSTKRKCQVRIVALPAADKRITKSQISALRADEVNQFVQFTGTIVRLGSRKMLDLEKQYVCQMCGFCITVQADPEQENMIPHPRSCVNMRVKRGSEVPSVCGCTNLREIESSRRCVDYQEIRVQDQVERLGLGCVPRSITVVLEADLVDQHNAGEDVVVVGQVLRQWRPVVVGSRCVIDIAIKANSVTSLDPSRCEEKGLTAEDMSYFKEFWRHYREDSRPFPTRMRGRNVIIKSACPLLYGLFYVKLAMLLTLIGGSATEEDSGVRRRQQSHLLLVGDPGCGKSQILKYAASLVPRSVLTTGIGTTGAGLTCSAVKDEGEWHLEAGALVLSNNGVCCIDEFSSIKEADRASIHEAMEQQTLSVAKAGLVVKLPARSTVIACCNPKGGTYDVTSDLPTNTNIASPLLSRFDLVLILLDVPDKQWDLRVSQFLLQQAVRLGEEEETDDDALKATADDADIEMILSATFGGSNTGAGATVKDRQTAVEGDDDILAMHTQSISPDESSTHNPLSSASVSASTSTAAILDFARMEADGGAWSLHALRTYLIYVKSQFHPVMSATAKLLLTRFYQLQRQTEDRMQARTTVRLLESLLRLSEAHAKLMCRSTVEVEDAVMAITLVSLSQTQGNILESAGNTLHSPFPSHEEAEANYEEQEARVLSLLHCSRKSLERDCESTAASQVTGVSANSIASGSNSRNAVTTGDDFSESTSRKRAWDATVGAGVGALPPSPPPSASPPNTFSALPSVFGVGSENSIGHRGAISSGINGAPHAHATAIAPAATATAAAAGAAAYDLWGGGGVDGGGGEGKANIFELQALHSQHNKAPGAALAPASNSNNARLIATTGTADVPAYRPPSVDVFSVDDW